MMAVKPTQEKVTIGDSTTVTAEGRSTACLTTLEGQDLQLEDFLYIPDFDRNIISLGRFASKGHRIEMTKLWIKVWSLNGKNSLKFEREGSLNYLTTSPCQKDEDEEGNNISAMQVIQKGSTVDIKDLSLIHI